MTDVFLHASASLADALRECRDRVRDDGLARSIWFIRGDRGAGVVVPSRYVIRKGTTELARPCDGAVLKHVESPAVEVVR